MMKRRSFIKNTAIAMGALALGGEMLQATNTKSIQPIIAIHGGTSGLGLSEQDFLTRKQVMEESLKRGQEILAKGGSAIDAVIAAIKIMEDSPVFNAGKGAVFTADGINELDASLMDGKSKKAGAVAMSTRIKNPIEGARVVMDKTWHTLIAGKGADELAEKHGLEMVDPSYFFTQHRYNQLQDARKKQQLLLDSDNQQASHLGSFTEPYLGTVGAIALDSLGNLAAGTSTGGMTNKMSGRIGDSPIIGGGNYADNDSVAVSCTGTGDIYIRAAAAHEASALYKYKKLSATETAHEVIKQIAALGGEGGIIILDKNGDTGFAWTYDKLGMFHGVAKVGQEPQVFFPVKS